MRIAVLVIGLALGIIVFIQSCSVGLVSGVGEEVATITGNEELVEEAKELGTAAGGGILMGLFAIAGAGFALKMPRTAFVLFALAALIGIPTGLTSEFGDLAVWGFLLLVPMALSYFSQDRTRRWPFRDAAVALGPRKSLGALPRNFCPQCGGTLVEGSKYCSHCGAEIL